MKVCLSLLQERVVITEEVAVLALLKIYYAHAKPEKKLLYNYNQDTTDVKILCLVRNFTDVKKIEQMTDPLLGVISNRPKII